MQNIVKNCLIVIILVSLDRKQFGLLENIYFWYPFPTFLVAWGRQTPKMGKKCNFALNVNLQYCLI